MEDICKIGKVYVPGCLIQEIKVEKITAKVEKLLKEIMPFAGKKFIKLDDNSYFMPEKNIVLLKSTKKISYKKFVNICDNDISSVFNGDIKSEWYQADSDNVKELALSYPKDIVGKIFCVKDRRICVYDCSSKSFLKSTNICPGSKGLAFLQIEFVTKNKKIENCCKKYFLELLKFLPLCCHSDKLIGKIAVREIFSKYGDFLDLNDKEDVIFDEVRFLNTGTNEEVIKNYFLTCDSKRADLPIYDETVLTDPKKGHWDLYDAKNKNQGNYKEITLAEPFWGRNPNLDCLDSAVCAIDFGTSSTVVACLNKGERLLRIGGNHSKDPKLEDYENPTVISLKDWSGFSKAYKEKEGRPFTEWNQVVVSRQAKQSFEAADSRDYDKFFAELKQWTNDGDRVRNILSDDNGMEILLPNFMVIKPGGFNPIEVYAYYLGLYINNMINGICLQYVLSFPVKYPKDVREKIRQSFENGIKKSLPEAVLNSKEQMENFEVYFGASEPAAYAACALNELNLLPDKKNPVYFAVFDFGGGTTDFNFGMMRLPDPQIDKGQYNFVIENFAVGGEINLGGEKLLNLLAYEVYKDNLNVVRKDKQSKKKDDKDMIPIALPIGASRFAGSELLITNTDAAYTNLKCMSNKLRNLWENPDNFKEPTIKIGLFTVGAEKRDVELNVDKDKLAKFIKELIAAGIDDFIRLLELSFEGNILGQSKMKIHILLAGNSCKSKYVKELFDEKLNTLKDKMRMKLPNKKVEELFVLHQPLGSEDIKPSGKKQEQTKNAEMDRLKTGKTGVAFGLLACRKGGHEIKMIDRFLDDNKGQAPFGHLLGRIDRKRHFKVTIGLGVEYGAWAEFTKLDDNENSFEIYYTTDYSMAQDGTLPIDQAECKRCRVHYDGKDKGGSVYLRKVDPHRLEFAVAKDEEAIKQEKYLAKPKTVEL